MYNVKISDLVFIFPGYQKVLIVDDRGVCVYSGLALNVHANLLNQKVSGIRTSDVEGCILINIIS